jgi:predicted nucleic acid-binding protein
LIYLDTSAALKLVRQEAESAAVSAFVGDRTDLVSSTLLAVEARRATLRNDPAALPRVDVFLSRIDMIGISDAIIESAGRLPDVMLRSLDAIHLATALLVREELGVLLAYDTRLRTAAAAHGLPTAAPGLIQDATTPTTSTTAAAPNATG